MGFAPTWLRRVSPPPGPASQNHFNHWSIEQTINVHRPYHYSRRRRVPVALITAADGVCHGASAQWCHCHSTSAAIIIDRQRRQLDETIYLVHQQLLTYSLLSLLFKAGGKLLAVCCFTGVLRAPNRKRVHTQFP